MKKIFKLVFVISPVILITIFLLIQNLGKDNNKQWYYNSLGINNISKYCLGSNQTIAVIDSGCDKTIMYSDNIETISLIDSSKNDTTGHGTQMISILVGTDSIKGICPEANIISYQVVNVLGTTSVNLIKEALNEAIIRNVDIICISIGGKKYSSELEYEINRAIEKHIIVCASIGDNSETSILYPAMYDGVIAVGAINSNNEKYGESNTTETKKIKWISGVDIIVPVIANGKVTYYYRSGSSYANAIFSGLCALFKENFCDAKDYLDYLLMNESMDYYELFVKLEKEREMSIK